MCLLFEAIRREPDYVHLQGLDQLDWNTQQYFLSRILKPFMKVRSIAGLVCYFQDRFGKNDALTRQLFDCWGQFQLSKMSHPCFDRPGNDANTDVINGLLMFPQNTISLDCYFAPLPVLPANNQLWSELTHRLGDGRNPMEAISFLTWVAIHDHQLGRALTAPLFELGHFTHTWSFLFEAHHICMSMGAPQIKMPMIVRSLKLSCMFLASKILQVSLRHTYPTDANPDGIVFLPMSNKEVRTQSFATDLLLNPTQIVHSGWTPALFHTNFSSEVFVNRFYDKLTSLKTGSLFHLSRPKTGISAQLWNELRPNKELTDAHNFIVAREKFIETHFLSHAPLAFAESKFSQIVPSPALFWLKDAK